MMRERERERERDETHSYYELNATISLLELFF